MPSWRIAALQHCRHYRLHFPFRWTDGRRADGGLSGERWRKSGGKQREGAFIWFFVCVCWACHPWKEGAASEQRPLHRMAAAQRSGAEGARRDSKQEIAAKSLGGRARPLKIPPRIPRGKKKIQMEGRLQPTHPPAVGCGRSSPSFVRSPRSSAMVPFTQRAGRLEVAAEFLSRIYR